MLCIAKINRQVQILTFCGFAWHVRVACSLSYERAEAAASAVTADAAAQPYTFEKETATGT